MVSMRDRGISWGGVRCAIPRGRMLFGSDWMMITPDRRLADFGKTDIHEEIRPKMLKANARELLGL
ncbi:putative TIM-barrel fold metal-dependent hydrolase [Bradyrhizobium sp. BR13661]|jgi:predicted TIM-barrel fold metal-dependent hydrolase|nr:putative TIM-barrel fold metal-dependent hydrolase [Bradyrhizobium sp. BR13661]